MSSQSDSADVSGAEEDTDTSQSTAMPVIHVEPTLWDIIGKPYPNEVES